MFNETVKFIRRIYNTNDFIPLHEPKFIGNEKEYLNKCIESTFVSSVGEYVEEFENKISEFNNSKYSVAVVNGTSALHTSLLVLGVKKNHEVITQALTFIATANAISYIGAKPIFLDVDKSTLGLSFEKLEEFLNTKTHTKDDGFCYNKQTGRKISACIPMHTFGHPVEIDKIVSLCKKYKIYVIEDAAESIGSKYKGKHTGLYGDIGVLSFNGNKIITSGGGGMLLTNDKDLAQMAKHLTTQAKIPHKWEFKHDNIAYNYRMPNINAALGLAQIESLDLFIEKKRSLAKLYTDFFKKTDISFFKEPNNAESNYWLNVLFLKNKELRNRFLKFTNEKGVMTRPIWSLICELEIYKDCQTENVENSKWLEERIVNIPSSVINQ